MLLKSPLRPRPGLDQPHPLRRRAPRRSPSGDRGRSLPVGGDRPHSLRPRPPVRADWTLPSFTGRGRNEAPGVASFRRSEPAAPGTRALGSAYRVRLPLPRTDDAGPERRQLAARKNGAEAVRRRRRARANAEERSTTTGAATRNHGLRRRRAAGSPRVGPTARRGLTPPRGGPSRRDLGPGCRRLDGDRPVGQYGGRSRHRPASDAARRATQRGPSAGVALRAATSRPKAARSGAAF